VEPLPNPATPPVETPTRGYETTMSATILQSAPLAASPASRWTGRVLSGIAVLFLSFDAGIKLLGAREAVEGTMQLGWQAHHLPVLAAIQLACLVLYLVPRTAPLGAVLWTGYLGGAIATHLRLDNPLFTHVLFPIYVAALLWGGLYLRDARVRTLARSLLRPAR
jgi:hypothetical protein